MPESRISPIEPPYETAIAENFNRIMPPGMEPLKLFRTMANNPRILQRMFAGGLLDKGAISLREREIVILRTCARCRSEYEWGVHVALFSERAGLSATDIAATLASDPAQNGLSIPEVILMKAVDELHETSAIADSLWVQLAAHYTTPQILEIIGVAGYYHTISFMTNAARVELEEFAPRFEKYLQAV